MNLVWTWSTFDELSPHGLYEILQARHRVFGLEQNCLFEDLDDHDQAALHLIGRVDGQLAAYLRLIPGQAVQHQRASASVHPGAASLGRVMTTQTYRQAGLGRLLMLEGIKKYETHFSAYPLVIGAQQYLTNFYISLGFVTEGKPFDEDGIPHINMRYRKSQVH